MRCLGPVWFLYKVKYGLFDRERSVVDEVADLLTIKTGKKSVGDFFWIAEGEVTSLFFFVFLLLLCIRQWESCTKVV